MRKIVVGNWKQNKTLAEIEAWFAEFPQLAAGNADIIIAAPFVYLSKVKELSVSIPNFYVAAQDVSEFEDGRHTGKVSATQLKDFVTHCLVGHSETGDSQEVALRKAELCLAAEITPILCFEGLENVPSQPLPVVVWEDSENISTADAGYRAKDADTIRQGVERLRAAVPAQTSLLYGGSVNRQNASELSNIDGLSGVLPGNASLDAKHFFEIVSAFN